LTPAPFKVRTEEDAGVSVIAIVGELDMNTSVQLERALEAPLANPDSTLLIDLTRCEFIDSTGIALIVRAWQQLDGSFALCGVGDQVERVLDITGLEESIPTHPSREEAIAKLHG
jgi:anti-sigma B factor antagonist